MPGKVALFAMSAWRCAARSSLLRDRHRRDLAEAPQHGDGCGENPDGPVISLNLMHRLPHTYSAEDVAGGRLELGLRPDPIDIERLESPTDGAALVVEAAVSQTDPARVHVRTRKPSRPKRFSSYSRASLSNCHRL